MDNRITELQQKLYGWLNEFHNERNGIWIDTLRENFGDDVLDVIKNGVDKYGLYRWHLETLLKMLELLAEKYGERVYEIVYEKQRNDRYEQGKRLAKEMGSNTLKDVTNIFTSNDDTKIIEKGDDYVLIKSGVNCLPGRIAYDINKKDVIYNLHCSTDPILVKGFNDNICCELVQTRMDGHDYCVHKIYVKE